MRNVPTVGDKVIYIPALDDEKARENGAEAIPAVVTQEFGTSANIVATNVCGENIPVYSVQKFTEAEGTAPTGQGNWMWPYDYERMIQK